MNELIGVFNDTFHSIKLSFTKLQEIIHTSTSIEYDQTNLVPCHSVEKNLKSLKMTKMYVKNTQKNENLNERRN